MIMGYEGKNTALERREAKSRDRSCTATNQGLSRLGEAVGGKSVPLLEPLGGSTVYWLPLEHVMGFAMLYLSGPM